MTYTELTNKFNSLFKRIKKLERKVCCDETNLDGWSLTGNAGTDPDVNFIGTTDGEKVRIAENLNSVYIDLFSHHGASSIANYTDYYSVQTLQGTPVFQIYLSNSPPEIDIFGNLKYQDGTQDIGKVLTSDAAGLASWQNINTILALLPSYVDNAAAITGGLVSGDSYYNTTDKVYKKVD